MALVYTDEIIPLCPDYPVRAKFDVSMFNLSGRLYRDSSWGAGTRPTVVYFPGSGASTPISGPYVEKLVALGYQVLGVVFFNYWNSSPFPFRSGYANVAAPTFTAHFIKDAWSVQCVLDWIRADARIDNDNIVLTGHSKGGTGLAAWAANYTCRNVFPVKAVFCNGITAAGLGNLRWNDLNRMIGSLSQIVYSIVPKTIISWGDQDPYAPPDVARRIQMAAQEDANIYFMSPGTAGHSWINDPVLSSISVGWVQQLMTGAPVRDRFGNIAINGPAA